MTPEEIRQLQHLVQQHQEHQHTQLLSHLATEEQKLLAKIPAWKKDHERARREIAEIKRHMVDNHGYTEADLHVIPDHRHVLAMRELYLGHQREAEAKRRAAEERSKRERQQKEEADKNAERAKKLDEARKAVRKHSLSTHHGAQALADALGEE